MRLPLTLKTVIIALALLSPSLAQQVYTVWEQANTVGGMSARAIVYDDPRLSSIVSYVNKTFKLPRKLPLVYKEAGEINAWYSPTEGTLTISYDLVSFLKKFYTDRGVASPDQAVRDTIVFVILHELGHGLIHELDLPAVGREEDAADELATLMASQALGDKGKQTAITAAFWFKMMGSSQISLKELEFWDEHSLDSQRFYKILCLVYGANPEETASIITPLVPYTRLRSASERYPLKKESWSRLLAPHIMTGSSLTLNPVLPDPSKPKRLTFESDSPKQSLVSLTEAERIGQFQATIKTLNQSFVLPKNLYARYVSTDVPVNFFTAITGQLILSREFFQSAEAKLSGLSSKERRDCLRSLATFSLLQEFGRGLIADARLPITCEPEEAASELAMILALEHTQLRSQIAPLSKWFQTLSKEPQNVLQLKYWSESALDQQRYYDLLGYLYSLSPSSYPQATKVFTPQRLQRYRYEYQQKKRSWGRLLAPFLRQT